MKLPSIMLTASLILVSQSSLVLANPLGIAHASDEYAVSTEALRQWSCGVLYEHFDREMERGADASFTHQMVYVGFDAVRWARLYAAVGVVDSKIGSVTADDNRARYTIGARFSLLDQEMSDPSLMEDRIGVTASIDYSGEQVAYPSRADKTDLSEIKAAFLVSVMNEIDTSKQYAPESISAFIGPIFSDYTSDYSALNEKDNVGYCVGLDILYTHSVSMSLAFEKFEDLGMSAGIHVSF